MLINIDKCAFQVEVVRPDRRSSETAPDTTHYLPNNTNNKGKTPSTLNA